MKRLILVVLLGMIIYDFSLHVAQLFDLWHLHPLFPIFASRYDYDIFWTTFWGIAGILVCIYLGMSLRHENISGRPNL